MDRLETSAERSFTAHVERIGFNAIKINKRSWPDRLIQLNNGCCFYIEFKRNVKKSGKRKGEKLQNHTHKKLRASGTHVYLCDDKKHAVRILDFEIEMSVAADTYAEYKNE